MDFRAALRLAATAAALSVFTALCASGAELKPIDDGFGASVASHVARILDDPWLPKLPDFLPGEYPQACELDGT